MEEENKSSYRYPQPTASITFRNSIVVCFHVKAYFTQLQLEYAYNFQTGFPFTVIITFLCSYKCHNYDFNDLIISHPLSICSIINWFPYREPHALLKNNIVNNMPQAHLDA